MPVNTLKHWRIGNRDIKPKLIEGVHWFRPGTRSILYNISLIEDWLANLQDPKAHEKAIEAYRASLPSNKL